MGPVAPAVEDDGFRPGPTPADARMFLGQAYDPAVAYRRNRLTGEIEPIGGPLFAKDTGQTTEPVESDRPAPSDRERLLELGRGEQNYSPSNREQDPGYSPMPAQLLPPMVMASDVQSGGKADGTGHDGAGPTAVAPVQYRPPPFSGSLFRPARSPSAADMFLGVARDIGDAIGDAYTTADNYRVTQTAKGAGALVGMPRATADFVDWAQKKTGVPPVALGLLALLPAMKNYLPKGDDVSRRLLDSEAKFRPSFKETTIHPIVDAGVQSIFLSPGLGIAGKYSPIFSFLTGAGSEAAGQAAHDHDQQRGTSWEMLTRFLGNLIGSLF